MRISDHTVRYMNANPNKDVNEIAAMLWADKDAVASSNKLSALKAAGENAKGLGYCRAWVLDRLNTGKATCRKAPPLPRTTAARAPVTEMTGDDLGIAA